MRKGTSKIAAGCLASSVALALLLSSCLPTPLSESGGVNLTVYGFSIMKESLEKAIYPGFAAKWKAEHGVDVHFTSSFAGPETITNQILQGVKADVAILSIERDAMRLKDAGFVVADWKALPQNGVVNQTPFVILVAKGNPKNIRDFPDLAKPGVRVIHPDPISSGGAQWSILAIYGSELVKSQLDSGDKDPVRALHTLQTIWRNVKSTPGSAREARTQFELGYGDALVTYELEGLLMKQAGANVEIVVPRATIFSEHPALVIDRNVIEKVKLVFRPEDVSLSKACDGSPQYACIARGIVEVTNFVGAYERVRVRVDLSEAGAAETEETPYYLTTETPESQTSKPIIATRSKPEAAAVKLKQGDRVAVNLTSFTVLPDLAPRKPGNASNSRP